MDSISGFKQSLLEDDDEIIQEYLSEINETKLEIERQKNRLEKRIEQLSDALRKKNNGIFFTIKCYPSYSNNDPNFSIHYKGIFSTVHIAQNYLPANTSLWKYRIERFKPDFVDYQKLDKHPGI